MDNPEAGADPVLAAGTRVGDFEILGLLGEGGMGQVYLAEDTTLGRRVALKLIKRWVLQNHGADRFLEEARATASFNHPHIVTLYAVGEHDGRPYLALEYLDGESLRARLATGPLPVRAALRCCRAVAEAIAEAHRRGLVHADLKPENVVISTDGRVRVVDFGLARIARGAPTAASGTPAYMAPERWRGAPPTGAIDVWALGVMLHELIAGQRPIADDALLHLAFAVDTLELHDLPAAPWAQLVRDCLAIDPAGRPTAEELVRRLAGLLELHAATADAEALATWDLGPGAGSQMTELATGAADPDAGELAAMRGIGAVSVELFRRYRRVLHTLLATSLPDLGDLAAATRRILIDDPAWAHAYALLAIIEGQTTKAAYTVLAAARAAVPADRDPSGSRLLDTLEPSARSTPEAAFHVVEEVFRRNEADQLAGALLGMWAVLAQRTEEAVATYQRLHGRFPDLSFGVDLAEMLRREARDGEAERMIRDWVADAPDNLPARIELVRIEANAGRIEVARERTREVVMIHGDRENALPELFEALVASDQFSSARTIADRMLAGSPLFRALGRHRIAMTSVFQGRFAAAYDAVRRAIAEHRAFGMTSELTQCLELARSVAPLVAGAGAQRRYTDELADFFANRIGDIVAAAAIRFELALLDRRGDTPPIDDHLAGLEDGPVRDVARRRMLRAAALAGCGAPQEAVAAGFSAFEENTASLVAFGLCARRVGELELARRSLERAARRWSSVGSNQSSPFHAVLARFHLAGVLGELGEHAAARAGYEAFLRCWSDPDRPVPEVAIARKMLESGSATSR